MLPFTAVNFVSSNINIHNCKKSEERRTHIYFTWPLNETRVVSQKRRTHCKLIHMYLPRKSCLPRKIYRRVYHDFYDKKRQQKSDDYRGKC